MKVLFVTRKYPPSVGGMELFAHDLVSALSAKIDVKLIKWSRSGRLQAVTLALPYLFVRSFIALVRGGMDIIHVQDGVLAPAGYILAKLFNKPLVVVIHGLDMTYSNWLFRRVVPPAIRRASAVVCISQAAATAVQQNGVPEAKIKVIPLAVTDKLYRQATRAELLEQLSLASDSQILLSVGRLVTRKGVAWFVGNVLPDLVQRYPKLIYLVIGEGEQRAAIEAVVAQYQLQTKVRLVGQAPDQLLAAAYNGADIFVMPNVALPGDMEGFGLVLLEAALCARPIVAADLEGIQEAVKDGRNAALVAPEDVQAWTAQITSFLDNPAAAEAFGKQARAYTLANFQWLQLAERYLRLYNQLKKRA